MLTAGLIIMMPFDQLLLAWDRGCGLRDLYSMHYDNSESTYFQYQNALALVLSAAQLCKFKEEDSHEAERGHSGMRAL